MVSPLSGSLARTIYQGLKGLFLDATLTRDPAPTGPTYDPAFAAATVYGCKAIAEEYGTGVQGLGLVTGANISIIILAKSLPEGFEPQSGDRLAIPSQNVQGTIVPATVGGLKAVQVDPARAAWVCRVIV